MKSKILAGLLIILLLVVGCNGAGQTGVSSTAIAEQLAVPSTTIAQPPITTAAALITSATAATGPSAKLASDTPYITADELKLMFDVGKATGRWGYISVDARDYIPFLTASIENSINIPPNTYNTDSGQQSILNQLKELPKDRLVVFYDDFEDLAPPLAQALSSLGYDGVNIKILKGGIDLWVEKGYPTFMSSLH